MPDTKQQNPYEGPPAHATTDEVIARLVVDELYWDSRVDVSKVQVEVNEGVVTLTGQTPTYADRYAAEADARMIQGVVSVENRIQVEHPKNVPDAELAQNVSTVLGWTPGIDASDIEVTAQVGTVTLKGSVPRYGEKLRAHLAAGRVEGIHRVIDELAVTPSANLEDREIAHSLTKALERRMPEEMPMLQITVKEGVVTLRGSVPNAALKHIVQKVAEHTTGVVAIRNELVFPHPA